MPDIWTKHPEIVRSLLEEGGFTCGVAPRVLKGRDPTWTCIVDGKTISGDLYIHHVDELLKAQTQMGLGGWLFVLLGLGVLLSCWRQRAGHVLWEGTNRASQVSHGTRR